MVVIHNGSVMNYPSETGRDVVEQSKLLIINQDPPNHTGVGYIPFYLQALDHQYKETGLDRTGRLTMLPSDYFRRQIMSSFWFETYGVAEAIRYLGNTNVMFETDFPHPSCLFDGTNAHVDNFAATVDQKTLERVLYRNAVEFFHLPALAPVDRELAVL